MSRQAEALLADPALPQGARSPVALVATAAAFLTGSLHESLEIWGGVASSVMPSFDARLSTQVVIQNVLAADRRAS